MRAFEYASPANVEQAASPAGEFLGRRSPSGGRH